MKHLLWITVATILLLGPGFARAGTAETATDDREAVEAALRGSLEAGYRDEDVGKFISIYEPEAEIATYLWGLIGPEEYGRRTAEDFRALSGQSVRLDVLELVLDGDEATATVSLGVTGTLAGGREARRHDRYFLLLRRTEEGWRIHRQGYRPDFTLAPDPHSR